MDITVAVFLAVLAIAALAWVFLGRSPAHEQGVERPVDDQGGRLERGTFGPAGAGSEQQTPPFDPDRGSLHR